jgi:SAM-dependent methyltransferase
MAPLALWRNLRSYFRGSRGRDPVEFYDLESSLPYFDQVSRILCAHKRRILLSYLRAAPVRGPVLELGAGIGTFARQLGAIGCRVIAVDISAGKTAKARKITGGRFPGRSPVRHLLGDLRELGNGSGLDRELERILGAPPPHRFDAVIAADVIEHLPDPPAETLERLLRSIAPGGRLLATVPSRLCLNDPGHLWRILPAEWEREFEAAGLAICRRRMSRICCYGLPTPLPLAMVYELRPVASPAYGAGGEGLDLEARSLNANR